MKQLLRRLFTARKIVMPFIGSAVFPGKFTVNNSYALQIFPTITMFKPRYFRCYKCCSFLYPASIFLGSCNCLHSALQRCILNKILNIFLQIRVVILYAKQIISFLFYDDLSRFFLTVKSIGNHHLSLDLQLTQKSLNCRYLIALIICTTLCKCQTKLAYL